MFRVRKKKRVNAHIKTSLKAIETNVENNWFTQALRLYGTSNPY